MKQLLTRNQTCPCLADVRNTTFSIGSVADELLEAKLGCCLIGWHLQ